MVLCGRNVTDFNKIQNKNLLLRKFCFRQRRLRSLQLERRRNINIKRKRTIKAEKAFGNFEIKPNDPAKFYKKVNRYVFLSLIFTLLLTFYTKNTSKLHRLNNFVLMTFMLLPINFSDFVNENRFKSVCTTSLQSICYDKRGGYIKTISHTSNYKAIK